MKFSGTLVFMSLWFLCVYAPIAHMVWGKGGLLNATLGGRFPTLDFAAAPSSHQSGVSSLVCALYLGKRTGYPEGADAAAQPGAEASSAPACCGSAGSGSTRAARSPPTVSRRARSWRPTSPPRQPRLAGSAPNGRRADGRARWARSPARSPGSWRFTPASGFVTPMPALLIGLVAGIGCFLMVTFVKGLFGYDMRWTRSACMGRAAPSARC